MDITEKKIKKGHFLDNKAIAKKGSSKHDSSLLKKVFITSKKGIAKFQQHSTDLSLHCPNNGRRPVFLAIHHRLHLAVVEQATFASTDPPKQVFQERLNNWHVV